MKKGKEKFDALVSKCISRDTMKKELVRRFSKRARQYMLSYKSIEMTNTNNQSFGNVEQSIYYQQIEKMKALLKCHRAAIDFDQKFVMKAISDFEDPKKRILSGTASKLKGNKKR